MNFGNSLKNHRKNKKLTLAELAELSALSISYLSKLENNATTPTLANMQKLCEALQISMIELLEEKPTQEAVRVIRPAKQPHIFSTASGVHYHMLFDKAPQAKIISMVIEADNFQEELSWGHHYDEFGLVIEGSMEISVGGEAYSLSPGDIIFIQAHEIHKYKKTGAEKCVSYWIYV